MSEVIAAILGALSGAGAVYLLDLRKMERERSAEARRLEEERQRRRAAVATGLLIDMRTLENTLRQLYNMPNPGGWRGVAPTVLYEDLLHDLVECSPQTVYEVANFFGLVRDIYLILQDVADQAEVSDRLHHAIRSKAGFALQALPPAAESLLREGGAMPKARPMELVRFPELPKVPARYFPVTMAQAGEPVPEKLK